MNRRKFLKYTGLGGLVAALGHNSLFAGILKTGKKADSARSAYLKSHPPPTVTRSNKVWQRITFPGPQHKNDPAFPPGQGSDRCEWMHFFKVSPADSTFMMTGIDMGAALVARDGRHFEPNDTPLHRWANNVTFCPHSGNTAYLLQGHSFSKLGKMNLEDPVYGIWRTRDKGTTWQQIYTMPPDAPSCRGPAGKQQIAIDPHPNRSHHIYYGSLHRGLIRSTDDGNSWHVTAFRGYPVKTISTARGNQGKTILYVIVGEKGKTAARNYIPAGHLWRLEVNAEEPFRIEKHQLTEKPEIVDVEVFPNDPTSGICIRRIAEGTRGGKEVVKFADQGNRFYLLRSIEGKILGFVDVHINPQAPGHVVVRPHSNTTSTAFLFSRDGGKTWNDPYPVKDGYMPTIKSYNPAHYTSPNGFFRDTWHAAQGPAIGFDSRDPKVVYWWTHNYDKNPLKSEDWGETWAPFAYGGPFKEAAQITVGTDNRHMGVARSEYGYVTSQDGGMSWAGNTYVNDPLLAKEEQRSRNLTEAEIKKMPEDLQGRQNQRKHAWGLASKPGEPHVFVGVFGHFASLLITKDGGITWEDTGADAHGIGCVYWNSQNPSIVYAADRKSYDGGETWLSLGRFALAVSARNGNVVVGCRNLHQADISVSLDAGESWIDLPDIPEEPFPGTNITRSPFKPMKICNFQNPHAVAVDPDPARDSLAGQSKGIRILAAGRSGIYEYTGGKGEYVANGQWQVLRQGLEPSIHFSKVEPVPWMGHVAFDSRPGKHHLVYACKSADLVMCRDWYSTQNPNVVNRNGQPRRPLYRSLDGGFSWQSLHAPEYKGMPDHIEVTDMMVAPDGTLFVDGFSGIFKINVFK